MDNPGQLAAQYSCFIRQSCDSDYCCLSVCLIEYAGLDHGNGVVNVRISFTAGVDRWGWRQLFQPRFQYGELAVHTFRSVTRMIVTLCALVAVLWTWSSQTAAQVVQQPVVNGPVARTPMIGPGSMGPGFGGASMADFDQLMSLITSTVQPESWEDVGGPGTMSPFATGVYIDPDGTLQKAVRSVSDEKLSDLRKAVMLRSRGEDVNRSSPLRKISLPRLEKRLGERAAEGQGPTVEMGLLAGLRRIEYLFVCPETQDLIIAGPAGPWRLDEENRFVSTDTNEPIVRLDDLIVVLRQMTSGGDSTFGCLIVPTQEGLARVKAFAEESAKEPLRTCFEIQF